MSEYQWRHRFPPDAQVSEACTTLSEDRRHEDEQDGCEADRQAGGNASSSPLIDKKAQNRTGRTVVIPVSTGIGRSASGRGPSGSTFA